MAETFIVRREWLENIQGLPVEQQDKVIGEFVRYGAAMPLEHEDDAVVSSLVNMLKNRIDYSIECYAKKTDNGPKGGSKKKYSDEDIYNLAKQGKRALEIAAILNCSESTVTHNIGWKQRDKEEFIF